MFFICLKVSKIQWMRSELSTLKIAQKNVIQRQCSDVQLFYYLTLFFHAYTAFLDLHLTCQKSTWSKLYIWWSCDITCSGNTSFQQLPLASSAFMTPIPCSVQRCSRTLWCIYNQCNYIPATPSYRISISGYLSRVFHNLVTSCVHVMLSNAHVAQFDSEEQMRHCLWDRTRSLATHGMKSGEFTQSCGCEA